MSASGGPAADNNELRAKLEHAANDLVADWLASASRLPNTPEMLKTLWPLIEADRVAFGDARYGEGRDDEANGEPIARGEG